MAFSRFWEAKVVIFGHFGSPAAPFGGSGPHFDDFWVCCDFGSVPPRKTSPILREKPYHYPTFWGAGFWVFFRSLFLSVFLDFGRPEAPF